MLRFASGIPHYRQTYDIAMLHEFRSGLDNYLTVLDAERSLFINQQNILQLELARVSQPNPAMASIGRRYKLLLSKSQNLIVSVEAMRPAMLMDDEKSQ